jgi:2'-deoxynucleoside 5'-phosphate N-hydrolase
MKIYFHCSLIGKKRYLKEYKTIVRMLKSLGHEVFADHIFNIKSKGFSREGKNEIYESTQLKKNLIKSCDAVVIESTYPSIGVGYIIAYALEQHKSVLILYLQSPHAILSSEKNRLLTLRKYSIKNETILLRDLKLFLERTQKKFLKYRFNMMIDQSLNDLLSDEANKLHISKADYVRQIIFEKFLKHKNDERASFHFPD